LGQARGSYDKQMDSSTGTCSLAARLGLLQGARQVLEVAIGTA